MKRDLLPLNRSPVAEHRMKEAGGNNPPAFSIRVLTRAGEAGGIESIAVEEYERLDLRYLGRLIARQGARAAAGDEIQAATERAQAKRGELLNAKPATGPVDNVFAALPRVADLYRNQIAQGLDGSPRVAAKARLLLREIFGGKVSLKRQGAELWAQIELRPGALLLRAACTDGSGGLLPVQAISLLRQHSVELSTT